MFAWRDRLSTAPMSVVFVVYLAFSILWYFGLVNAWHPPPFGVPDLAFAATVGLLNALALTVFLEMIRRREKTVTGPCWHDARTTFNHVMRTGEIPMNSSLDVPLLVLVERHKTRLRGASFAPWLFGGFALLLLRSAIPTYNVLAIALTLLVLILLGEVCWTDYLRGPNRLAQLEEALRLRSAQHATSTGEGATPSTPSA
jgi:hypothetical protein